MTIPDLSHRLYEYVEQTSGWFYTEKIYTDLGIKEAVDKSNVRVYLKRWADKGLLERDTSRDGRYRKIQSELVEMDVSGASPAEDMGIIYPFELEKVFLTIPKSVIIIAGGTDAGKTVFCIELMLMNQHKFDIHYFSSELTASRLKRRLLRHPDFANLGIGFRAYEHYENYADVIKPNGVNVIDFLDVDNSTPYMIGNEIKNVFRKLDSGVAYIAIQKKSAQKDWGGKLHEIELGVGGETTIRRASIYLTMDGYPENKLTIRKAKEWATELKPVGLTWKYNIVDGVKFVNIQPPWELKNLPKPDDGQF